MEAEEFKAWRVGWKMTQSECAVALGFKSYRQIYNYETGVTVIHRWIELALIGYDSIHRKDVK